MRVRITLILLAAVAIVTVAGCSVPEGGREPEPRPAVCADSVYLELAREHPDSLSDRAWERLQQLEAACDRRRAGSVDGAGAAVRADHHGNDWVWMPAMMGFGLIMWLMMGGGF